MSNGYIKHRLLTLSNDVFKNKQKKKEKTDWGHIKSQTQTKIIMTIKKAMINIDNNDNSNNSND